MGGGGILGKSGNFDSLEKWEPHKYNGESYYVLASYLIGDRKIQEKFSLKALLCNHEICVAVLDR